MTISELPVGNAIQRPTIFPEGLVGDVADAMFRAAPYPNATIALAGAIGFLAGISGRSFNVNGTGLNQYVLVLAPTGAGKDAISDGISRFTAAIKHTVPGVADFRGPGELVSAPGLFKWLARLSNPSIFSVIGEFGLMLKAMAAPNANANMAGLQRLLLQLYSKSGKGGAFEAAAYSDRDNNTGIIDSPSLTIIGEGVPDTFYAALDEGMIASGLLPRLLLFETTDRRPYQNLNREIEPCPQLVHRLSELAVAALHNAQGNIVHNVEMCSEARSTFVEFERWTTDEINNASNETTRQLWNRANLKALKLAAIIAVGRDPQSPCISLSDCMWATNLIVEQTKALIAKFESGETGMIAGNEVKQQDAIRRCIYEYMTQPYDRFSKYGITRKMHEYATFTQSYLSRRLINLPTFKNDRIGATNALKRALTNLAEGDEIREYPKTQLAKEFNTTARAFAISDPEAFLPAGRMKYGGGV
jgi:hypothetical protein